MTGRGQQDAPRPCRLVVLVSGGGTTLQAIIDAVEAGELPAEIVSVISSRREAKALARAQKHGIQTSTLRPRDFASPADFDVALSELLGQINPDLLVLAGYLSILGERVIDEFRGRIMNIHPSLLPAFGGKGCFGKYVHEQVLQYGCKISGATVMFVDSSIDTGPIILQECIHVCDDDSVASLSMRIGEVERRLYPEAIRLYAEGRLQLEGRKVRIEPGR